ncbi:MAG: TonB-dependent receptor [Pseudomonadota bacterium]|nr:TonB-dependent receptor [Pseudomonadota bacterium]
MSRHNTESPLTSCLHWCGTALCLWLPAVPLLAADHCFYDGISQTSAEHIIRQVSDRYQIAVLTGAGDPADNPLAQPLGDCSVEEFLTLATRDTGWHYRLTRAGAVLFYQPQPEVDATPPAARAEEVIVTGSAWLSDQDLAARYRSTTVTEKTALSAGQLSGSHDLTSAMAAISAVTFSQEAGMDRNISIRGLDADFTQVLVNGMPMPATGTSIDSRGAVNNSRRFDFDLLPQGLFTDVLVYKSPDARQQEGGISGSVDLRLPRPLENDSLQQRWLTVQGENNVRNGSDGVALAAGFQHIRDDGRLGWLLSASYRQRSTEEKGYSTVRWQAADWGEQPLLSDEQQTLLASGEVFSPRHNRYDILHREQQTLGISSVLQWQSEDDGRLTLSGFSVRSRQAMHEYHISSSGLKYEDLSAVQVNDFAVNSAGMVYGDFSSVDIRTEHNYEEDETRLQQLRAEWALPLQTDWTLNSSLGYQSSVFDSPVHDKVSLMAYDQDFSFDLRSNNRIAVNRYGFDISDPQQWQLYRINLQEDNVSNRYLVADFELAWEPLDSLQHYAGVSLRRFTNQRQQAEYDNDDVSGYVSGYYRQTPGNFSAGLDTDGLPHSWVVGSHGLIRYLGLSDAELVADPLQQRQLNEDSASGWWQTEFSVPQLSWPLQGNVGLRYVQTRQRVEGNWLIDDEVQPMEISGIDHDWLPSLHLLARARRDLLLRFGYSRTLSRPSVDELTSPLELRSSAMLIEGGNTELEPSHAHGFDLALEWYGQQRNFFSAGLFYQRIDSLILDVEEELTLDQLPYYNPLWDDLAEGDIYTYRHPVNGPGTDLSGLEFSLQLPFFFLPSPFNRFGLDAGYALNQGVVRYPLDDGHITLPPPGLSRHVVNGTLWYRDYRFSSGITVRGRSRYLTRVPGANDNDREGVNSSVIVGAYAAWDINPQLTISLDARNLTNEAFDLFVDSSNRVYSYSVTGTEVFFSLNWNFRDD